MSTVGLICSVLALGLLGSILMLFVVWCVVWVVRTSFLEASWKFQTKLARELKERFLDGAEKEEGQAAEGSEREAPRR
jgi:hypothetical protein